MGDSELNSKEPAVSHSRIQFIDVAKGLGIILVVACHVIGEGSKPFTNSKILSEYIYSFHMAIFFVIGGVTLSFALANLSRSAIKKKILSIVHRLLIPYCVWSAIYFVIHFNSLNDTANVNHWTNSILSFRGIAPIWFLGALFWAELISILIICLTKNRIKLIGLIDALILLLSVLFWLIYIPPKETAFGDYCLVAALRGLICLFLVLSGYISAGFVLKKNKTVTNAFISVISMSLCLILFIIGDNKSNLHTYFINNIFAFLPASLLGAFGIIHFAKMLCNNINLRILARIGQDSLGIMCIHYIHFPFMLYGSEICYNLGLTGFPGFMLSFVLVFLISWGATEVLKRYRVL